MEWTRSRGTYMKNRVFPLAGVLLYQIMLLQGCMAVNGHKNLAENKIPDIKKDCSLCHLAQPVTKETPSLKKSVAELCIECHPDRKAPSEHRVDIVPSMKVRKLPLTNAAMTCVTCHDPHANAYGKMLRVPAKSLCMQCHDK